MKMEVKNGNNRLLSKLATNNEHGENSPYFDGWKAYDNNPFHPTQNPNGVIQMGLAENQLSFDLIEKWIKKNPKASICSPEGVEAFKDIAIFQDYHGLPEFRNAVAKFMAKSRGDKVNFDPERIIMAGGATGANELLMFCLADPGDAFLIPTPYYPAFDRDLRWRTGVQLLPVVCEKAYENAQKANIKVKGLIFTNPSNPLGTTMDNVTLKALVTFINDKQIHLVCDEIYAATVHTLDYVSISEVVQEMEDRCNRDLIHVVYSLSKDMGLPGFRVGIVYSYNDEVVNIGRKMSSFGLVSSQTQHLLASMLSDEEFVDEFLSKSTKRLASRHSSFTKGLEQVGIRCLESNAGLFCWMDLKPLLKEPTFEEEMRLWKVIINDVKLNVSPGSSFHCHEPGWFRVCFANMDDETMEVALTRIRMFVGKGKEEAKVTVKKEHKMWQRALMLTISSRMFDENVMITVPVSSPHMMSPHSPLVRART
ncbi:1-aminocyclopropane-1-carboxylate synthase [Phtheirospermum japonicum]|uniref:1-aminocyclopropane-1-carboxylate synthase n=1 Tax=Phtheirospermum japonicum TaxID=374723 RepID=A0A830CJR0_9LAMI|nr:1-aminocyclopropane-1-carboxylate synthase [Phtheirospermum japonicum]